MKDRIAKSLFWIVWSRLGLQTLSFLHTIIVARLLSPSDYGLIAMATVWTATMSLLTEMGLGTAIVQFRNLEEGELNACFWVTMGVSLCGYLALYIASPAISFWFANPRLADILRVLGVMLPLLALRVVPDSLLRQRLALDKVAQAETGAALVSIPVVLCMAWIGAGVWALVSGMLLRSLVQDLITFWYVRWCPGLRLGGKQLREVFRFSFASLGTKMCWALYSQADTVVLGKVSGELILGFYSMAKELALLPVTKIAAVLNQLVPPMMAELQGSHVDMRNTLLRILRLVACTSFPMCIGLMLVAHDLVKVFLDEKWMPIVPMIQILALYAVIRSQDVFLPPVLLARYRAQFLFGYTLMLLGVMSLAFWAGAVWFGSIGVSAVWVVIYPLVMAYMARETFKELDLHWKIVLRQVQMVVVATLIMAVIVLAVQWVISGYDTMGNLVRLSLSFVVGAVTYGLVMLLWGRQVLNDLREVVTWVFQPKKRAMAGK